MPKRKKVVEDIIDEELIETEPCEWYATQGKQPPEKWDWKLIKKEWKALKMPKDVAYDPFHIPFSANDIKHCGYYILISKRGVGKTTSMILLGMILFKLYGVKIQYIRQRENMLKPKFAQELMSTILSCGYISKLTGGRWNYATYYANRWTFANIDENGKITEKTNVHFMYTLSVDQSFTYKSNYNAPDGDFTLFDEFIGKTYTENEFVYYMDILSTILRKRTGCINVLVSNNIEEYSEYFDEFEINERLRTMKRGDCDIIVTPGQTKIYVELIDHFDKNAARLNKEYFGFKNPRLNAITGVGEWAVTMCKHFDYDDNIELLDRSRKIKMGLNMVALELYRSEKYGLIVRVRKATKLYDDSIIYTMDEIEDARYRKGKGYSKVDNLYWNLFDRDLWHYATNSQKNFIDKYIDIC